MSNQTKAQAKTAKAKTEYATALELAAAKHTWQRDISNALNRSATAWEAAALLLADTDPAEAGACALRGLQARKLSDAVRANGTSALAGLQA